MTTRSIVGRLVGAGGLIAVVASTLGAPTSAFAQCGPAPRNLPRTWCFVEGPHVRVWWDQSFVFDGDEQKAIQVRDAVEGYLWPLYEEILGRVPLSDGDRRYLWNGGDGRYDIVLASDVPGLYGDSPLVIRTTSTAPPARFSLVRRTLVDRKLLSVVAHQLMRGFLTAFSCSAQCRWLEEATATWAEHLAYPKFNTEHEYAQYLFKNPTLSLHDNPSEEDLHKSGAYLFLLFLQRSVTQGATIVRHIWDATETFPDSLSALDAAVPGGLKGVWRQFITNNWNVDPALVKQGSKFVPVYRAWDRLTEGVYSRKGFSGPHRMDVRSTGSVETSLNVTLPPLSAAYFLFDFDISVRTVTLDHNLKRLRDAGVSGAELVVFTKLKGENWKIEGTWDGENRHQLCRDKAGEHLEQMVVILGNSSVTSSVSFMAGGVPPRLVASRDSCVSNPDAGYEECRLEFPLTKTSGKSYQNVETQSWEITALEQATSLSCREGGGLSGRVHGPRTDVMITARRP